MFITDLEVAWLVKPITETSAWFFDDHCAWTLTGEHALRQGQENDNRPSTFSPLPV